MTKKYSKHFFDRLDESWLDIKPDEFLEFILPKSQEILTANKLVGLLEEGRKLVIKFGIDPTAKDIHLGHIVPIMILRQFQRAGHKIKLVIGDFTARVGDPSGRTLIRKPISPEEIDENQKTYKDQIGKYLSLASIDFFENSSWLRNFSLEKFFDILQSLNLTEAIQRDDFRERLKNDQGVSLAEVCYGILMAIDSIQLGADIEVGGIDQLLNFQQCRKIMPLYGLYEEVAFMTPILEGTSGDGKKMSKSFNNYIAVNSSAEDKFGKIMSIQDKLIFPYFVSFADVNKKEIPELEKFINDDPLEAKKQLATFIVAQDTNSMEKGEEERESFERKFSQKIISDEDCVDIKINKKENLFNLLFSTGMFSSKSELNRIFLHGGVHWIEPKSDALLGPEVIIRFPSRIRVGKRRFFQFY